ncbi:MAG: APC family permease [Bacteroidia bacterium]
MTQTYSRRVATNMVVANMIGTGIFTSIGFQVLPGAIPDPFAILLIWLLGGVLSIFGATAYAEIATHFQESGGEYVYLSKLYHPVLGLASGWVSLVVGFSAASASLGLAAGEYLASALGPYLSGWPLPVEKLVALAFVGIAVAVQFGGVQKGGRAQNWLTAVKLLFIVSLIALPFLTLPEAMKSGVSFAPSDRTWSTVFSLPFAGSLVWVMFAYSGWNAATYIAGNLENPQRNLPRAVLLGTGAVALLYLALNAVFLYSAPMSELAGRVDVGNLVLERSLGVEAAQIFTVFFALTLLAGVNAMFIAGPRVVQRMGQDHQAFQVFERETQQGSPRNAILAQALVTVLFVLFTPFKDIIEYIGITLTLFSVLTVAGVFVLRFRGQLRSDAVKTWGYPITPLIFIAAGIWMTVYFVQNDPWKLAASLLTLAPALIMQIFKQKLNQN